MVLVQQDHRASWRMWLPARLRGTPAGRQAEEKTMSGLNLLFTVLAIAVLVLLVVWLVTAL